MGWYTTKSQAQIQNSSQAIVTKWLHAQGHYILGRSAQIYIAKGPLGQQHPLTTLKLDEGVLVWDVRRKGTTLQVPVLNVLRHGIDLEDWEALFALQCDRFRLGMAMIQMTPHKSVQEHAKRDGRWPKPRLLVATYDALAAELKIGTRHIDMHAHKFASGMVSWDIASFADHGQLDGDMPRTLASMPAPGFDRYSDWTGTYPKIAIRERPQTQLDWLEPSGSA